MGEDGTVDFIHLADEENSVLVRVLGRHMPGVLQWHDHLDAEIVVTSGFACGRLDVCLSPEDLDSWAGALDALAAGQDIHWMQDGRAPELRIHLNGERGIPEVVVEDVPVSGTSVRVPVGLPDGWIEDQRERLERLRQAWPSEVIETSPFVHQCDAAESRGQPVEPQRLRQIRTYPRLSRASWAPEPKLSSSGRCSHVVPVCSTNKIPCDPR